MNKSGVCNWAEHACSLDGEQRYRRDLPAVAGRRSPRVVDDEAIALPHAFPSSHKKNSHHKFVSNILHPTRDPLLVCCIQNGRTSIKKYSLYKSQESTCSHCVTWAGIIYDKQQQKCSRISNFLETRTCKRALIVFSVTISSLPALLPKSCKIAHISITKVVI